MNKKLKEKIKSEAVDFVVKYAKIMGVILGFIGVIITIILLGCGPLILILKAKVLALRIIGGILVVPCIALLITIMSTISGDSDDY